ncbi:MAG: uracil-DNA glycosylase [Alphaproteobacteria bacterium]|mgnify:FL=1|jgi:DNA polymerase|nr:uracil-DNA glycosylase [Alphaproteobacteria bacterium]MDP6239001.1 uracil-DNA glycosylase [Alphaproteobacteria bacterium]MDP7173231.1 uracil-DNA glycosylase [Alphaproteobacteria bacterium]MDP7487127.1 uracil-DNA glycosylase [Alphaproteobacteria bacterium]MEE1543364.1 uracil-DNA glycosylase [Alphaproteobacteria bacterium]|tara:strand:- start:1372 stop:2163 length:792 start_codon:yes stop_codon:yes gene_type:complete
MAGQASGDLAGALSALAWLIGVGADEALDDTPRDRLVAVPPEPEPQPKTRRVPAAAPALTPTNDLMDQARAAAEAADSVTALAEAVAAFDGCALKATAKNTVFANGNPQADLMLIGEAPGAEEDRRGLPFVGKAGQLLDRMLAAIGRDRDSVYITNMLFWRPPGNRSPSIEEIALCRPFVDRHMVLAGPKLVVCVGGISAKALLGCSEGITRLRGKWYEIMLPGAAPIPATAMFHPAYLLRQPAQKRLAWRDLLAVRDRLAKT